MKLLQTEQVVLHGLTKSDIQDIIKQALEDFKGHKPNLILLDGSYLYTFSKEDIPFINKYIMEEMRTGDIKVIEEGREVWRNPKMIQWHQWLERWCMGQTIEIYGKQIKPLKIVRSIDRVVNDCLGKVARSFTGQDFNTMNWAGISDGEIPGSNPSPNDHDLAHEVARIDVLSEDNGGDLSSDGNTFYNVASYSVDTPSAALPGFTGSAIFDKDKPPTGSTIVVSMGDHSVFDDAVPHTQGSDAPGVTTFIYTCGS